ncbi:MAG: stage II sporulation protein M [Sporomusaceae bacterium]|nr:stage II sporulation protein M [Sporomusaceae bacterium]
MLKSLQYSIRMFLRNHIVAFFFMVLFFSVGIVVGALAVKVLPDEQKIELAGYLHLFFSGLSQGTEVNKLELFGSALWNQSKVVLFMWILGFTIVGIPFVIFLVFTRGFIIGFTVGFLVNEYVMRGLLFAFAAVIPHSIFSVPAVLVAGVAAASFSWMLLKRRGKGKRGIVAEAVSYSFICFVMLCLMITAAAVEVYISPVFMKLAAGFLVGHTP